VVADTCYAAALARSIEACPTVVLIAACGEWQMSLSRRQSNLVTKLERIACPDGAPTPEPLTYERLERELQRGTPDVERPRVWVNRADAWGLRPFA
jgi:hypothetical protein